MQVSDWRKMTEEERKRAKSQLYGLMRNYAVASGARR
jgi:hypothetical protein